MENYAIDRVVEIEDDPLPFTNLATDVIHMKVRSGSKIRGLLDYAFRHYKDDNQRQIVFSGSGQATNKVISCCEIFKRQNQNKGIGLHQITKVGYRKTEEYWEPKSKDLDPLKVVREVPVIHILLNKDAMDVNELGYQAPGQSMLDMQPKQGKS